jgi:hypothetical protein
MATPIVYSKEAAEDDNYTETTSYLQHERWLLHQTGLTTSKDLSLLIKLDLPNCNLSGLPETLPTLLPNLEILFCPQNHFTEVPAIIGDCSKLRMCSFKEQQTELTTIHENALQKQLQWLILTGNKITEIPTSISRCTKLQKLMLSGNKIRELPEEISHLENLELLRVACNQLSKSPISLLRKCPKLKWIALSGNPFLMDQGRTAQTTTASLSLLQDPVLESVDAPILGKGAGGITRKVTYGEKEVAVKTFVGHLTSDGSPQDEKAISLKVASLLQDDSFIQLLGETSAQGSLVMEFLIDYEPLGNPPNFETCTRDVYPSDIINYVSSKFAWTIVQSMLRVLSKLHSIHICHGDFYAHNILINSTNDTVKLSDFGAAFMYDTFSEEDQNAIQQIELQAYQVLVQELYDIIFKNENTISLDHPWIHLIDECSKPSTTFDSLMKQFFQ